MYSTGMLQFFIMQKSCEKLPPSLAKFSTEEDDVLVYVGYGMQKCIQFYSLSQRKVRTGNF